jgi:hypothetical protein
MNSLLVPRANQHVTAAAKLGTLLRTVPKVVEAKVNLAIAAAQGGWILMVAIKSKAATCSILSPGKIRNSAVV